MGESKGILFDFPENCQKVVVLDTTPATDDKKLHVVAPDGEEVEMMIFFFFFIFA